MAAWLIANREPLSVKREAYLVRRYERIADSVWLMAQTEERIS